jgi:hypothetical protein
VLIAGLSIAVNGCGGKEPIPPKPPEVTKPVEEAAPTCQKGKNDDRPLAVSLTKEEREQLRLGLADGGLLPVKYENCELVFLKDCQLNVFYEYMPASFRKERVAIRDAKDLFDAMPIHGADTWKELKRSGELGVSLIEIGRWESHEKDVGKDDLRPLADGGCNGATHLVTAASMGAFRLQAGAIDKAQSLLEEGVEDACAHATTYDRSPPDNCAAALRIELTPLPEGGVIQPGPCAIDTFWDRDKHACEPDCYGAKRWDPEQKRCVAPTCAADQFWDGYACVARQTDEQMYGYWARSALKKGARVRVIADKSFGGKQYVKAGSLGRFYGARDQGTAFIIFDKPVNAPESLIPFYAAGGAPAAHQKFAYRVPWSEVELVDAFSQSIPQQCKQDASSPAFGLVVGQKVTLGRHRPVQGQSNWLPAMDPFVGVSAKITALKGLDAQGCAIAQVDVDGGRAYWRVRDMKTAGSVQQPAVNAAHDR